MEGGSSGSCLLVCTLVLFLVLMTPKDTTANPVPLQDDTHSRDRFLDPLSEQGRIPQLQTLGIRGKRDLSAYWKRAPDQDDDTDGYGFHAGNQQGPWRVPALLKRSGEGDGRVLRAIMAFRDYLELQRALQQRAQDQLNAALRAKSVEVVDKNLEQSAQASGDIPKQQRRRQDPMARPEFNPTGW